MNSHERFDVQNSFNKINKHRKNKDIAQIFGQINFNNEPKIENILDTFNKLNTPLKPRNILDTFSAINNPNKVVDLSGIFAKENDADKHDHEDILDIFNKINYPFESVNIASAFEKINNPERPFDILKTFEDINQHEHKPESSDESIFKGPKTELVIEDGQFLRRAVIIMWAFFVFNALCLTAGGAPKREKADGEKGIELP